MNHQKHRSPPQFIVGFLAIIILGCSSTVCGAADTNSRDMVLWYRQPAQQWHQAMPLGNGMIGAMVFGGIPQERIALNESSFWSGRPHDYDDTNAFQYFPQIRDLVFAEKFQEAEKMANDHFWGIPKAQEAYQPIGDLLLDFGTTNFTDYRRELDMETGIAKVSYRFGRRGDHARGVCLLAGPCSGGAHQRGQAGSDKLFGAVSWTVFGYQCRRWQPPRHGRNVERSVPGSGHGHGRADCAHHRQRPSLRGGAGRTSRRRSFRSRWLRAQYHQCQTPSRSSSRWPPVL